VIYGGSRRRRRERVRLESIGDDLPLEDRSY